ncbi:hypothetical protein BX666DRAFT_2030804 [Dichotomocladium elegans]|nr:hypothetical protein BX666DRAFT_2030804 [Dichotomocladium elegans]
MSPSSTIDLAVFLATTGPSENIHSRRKARSSATATQRGRHRTSAFSRFYRATTTSTAPRNSVAPKHVPLPVNYEASELPNTRWAGDGAKTCTPSSSATTTTAFLASAFPQVPSPPPQAHPPSPPTTPPQPDDPSSSSSSSSFSCPHCARPIHVPRSHHRPRRLRRESCPAAIRYTEQPQTKPGLTSQEARTLLQMIEELQKQIIKEKAYRQALEDALYLNV